MVIKGNKLGTLTGVRLIKVVRFFWFSSPFYIQFQSE